MSQGRLFEILYLLLEKGKMPATALAEHFEVSVRTIYRDIDALSSAGVPIYSTPGRGGGIAVMDHYSLSKAVFSENEQIQLLTALKSLSGNSGLDTQETLTKLSALFRRSEPDWLQVDLAHWGNDKSNGLKFQTLKDAIFSCKVIAFTYADSYGRLTGRQALPVRLVFKGQAWYLQGFCLDKQAYRTFRISRIRGLSVTDKSITVPLPPPSIDDKNTVPPSVKLKLRFSPSAAFRVYDEFSEEQIIPLPNGSIEVNASFPEGQWVYGFLLSFAGTVEIIEPNHIRQAVGALAKKMWELYDNHDKGCHGFCDTMGIS